MRIQFLLILTLFLCGLSLNAYEVSSKNYKVKANVGRQFLDENKVELEGDVSITYKDSVLYCERLVYNSVTKDFTASGKVRIVGHNSDFRSNEITGNLDTKLYQTNLHHLTNGPFYIIGQDAQSFPDRSLDAQRVRLTTCDQHHHPHWHIEGSEVHYDDNGDFEVWNPTLYFGGFPVFWLPYMKSDIAGNDGMFQIVPGYSSDWGAFLLISTAVKFNEHVTTKFMLDYRSKKGLGGGVETDIKTENSSTKILLYGSQDSDPPDGNDGFNRFEGQSNRYRIHLNHISHFYDDKLTLRAKVDKMSDHHVIKDFFKTYKHDEKLIQYNSYFDAEWIEENYAWSVNYRPRLNDFYSVVERSPEVSFDLPRYEFAEDWYYTNYNTLARLETRWRDFDVPLPTLDGFNNPLNPLPIDNEDYNAIRFDSLHMFHYQTKVDNWLNLIPRAGLRLTYYSDSSDAKIDENALSGLINANNPERAPLFRVSNYDDDGGSLFRVLGEVGFEANFKMYNTNNDYKSDYWEIDGLRHVIQPYMNWNWIPFSTEDRDNIYFFDEIDRIVEQNFVRVGVDQRWQTRRDGEIHTFLTVENYVDFHVQSEVGSEGLGDFGTKVEWIPFDNFAITSDLLIDLNEADINEYRLGVSYRITDKLLASFGYSYRADYTTRDIFSNGSTISNSIVAASFANQFSQSHGVSTSLSYRINPKTLIIGDVSYSLTASRISRVLLELQRKLHCWTIAARIERDSDAQMKYLLYFYLNAYPDASIGGG